MKKKAMPRTSSDLEGDIETKTEVPVCSDFQFLRKRLTFPSEAGVIVTAPAHPFPL